MGNKDQKRNWYATLNEEKKEEICKRRREAYNQKKAIEKKAFNLRKEEGGEKIKKIRKQFYKDLTEEQRERKREYQRNLYAEKKKRKLHIEVENKMNDDDVRFHCRRDIEITETPQRPMGNESYREPGKGKEQTSFFTIAGAGSTSNQFKVYPPTFSTMGNIEDHQPKINNKNCILHDIPNEESYFKK